jgi:hypothetical protein
MNGQSSYLSDNVINLHWLLLLLRGENPRQTAGVFIHVAVLLHNKITLVMHCIQPQYSQ